MASNHPETGYPELDADLGLLFDLEGRGDLDGLDIEELVQKIGIRPVRLAYFLTEDGAFIERYARADPGKLRPILNRARNIASTLFGYIFNNPDRREEFEVFLKGSSPAEHAFYKQLRVIEKVFTFSEWRLFEGFAMPRLRVSFINGDDEVLLDCSLDWDDLIFVSSRLIDELRDDLENLDLLAPVVRERLNLKSEFGARISSRIKELEVNLQHIKKVFTTLGFSEQDFSAEAGKNSP
jgi:hypothetical protein